MLAWDSSSSVVTARSATNRSSSFHSGYFEIAKSLFLGALTLKMMHGSDNLTRTKRPTRRLMITYPRKNPTGDYAPSLTTPLSRSLNLIRDFGKRTISASA
ncbi:hypothetical protein AcW1_007067 [Taiwanofungus camphoratus]|nr:hypothetical protein AcW2_005875 [Antrodia cinnamomea]KAI0955508.1 hypothetical protein AcW1_007067 [Antrodia cinnamomea]